MTDLGAALEATALAQFLKSSYWVYPLVNAGHILGIALLVGAVVPLDLTLAGVLRRVEPAAAVALLRPFAIAGLALAATTGALLFITQAGDYLGTPVFLAKLGLIGLALANALLHLRLGGAQGSAVRVLALLSLGLWPTVLVLGRLIGYAAG